MKLSEMSRDERSLLLYFESRAVDHGGLVDARRINDSDFKLAQGWDTQGFVSFGRLASEYLTAQSSHWCHLSQEAWELAHEERRARHLRLYEKRTWQTTEEKRNG